MDWFARTVILVTGLAVASLGAVAPAQARPAPSAGAHRMAVAKTVTVQLEYPQHGFANTIPQGTFYSCQTGVFAPFVDIAGWDAWGFTYFETDDGETSDYFKQISAPYDDNYVNGGQSYPAAPGTHHSAVTLPYTTTATQDSSTAAECAKSLAHQRAIYGATAVMTYYRDQKCEHATDQLDAATKAVKKAKKAAANTTGHAHQQALAALAKAKAKLKKAKKKAKQACPNP